MLHSLIYNIKQGGVQLLRNKGMSAASVFSITAMLLILGLFFVVLVNVNMFTEAVKQDYDQIEVYLLDDTSFSQAEKIMDKIADKEGVKEVGYRTKDDALKIMKERWGESGYLLDTLGENPLPASIVITVDSLDHAIEIADYAGSFKGVEDIQYYQETVEKLTAVTDFIEIAALVIMGFLVFVSVIVVSNTVKLTVLARSKEIKIMRYIGATNWFIRGPFLAEGVIIGVIAAVVSSILMSIIYGNIVSIIGNDILAILSCPLISVGYLSGNLIIIFLALGGSIGAWGSLISMRKFLDA